MKSAMISKQSAKHSAQFRTDSVQAGQSISSAFLLRPSLPQFQAWQDSVPVQISFEAKNILSLKKDSSPA